MYFKKVNSLNDLKEQFKKLARVNHPDAGGNAETMKEINSEYDQLFPIWRHHSRETTNETADSTRREFYTENGWKGSKHDWNRTTKEVAACIRAYIKEIYPTYKFSVRFSQASMCSEIHIELKEAPADIYKTYEELNDNEKYQGNSSILAKLERNQLFNGENGWKEEEFKNAVLKAWKESDFYKVYNNITKTVIDDINREVDSYNYEDIDGRIDYFHVDFYYFGVKISDSFKVVPKTARVKEKIKSKNLVVA